MMTRNDFSPLLAGSLLLLLIPTTGCYFAGDYPSGASSADGRGYTETRYPIVLAHGLFGFDDLLGVIDYWPGLAEAMEEDGAEVFITDVSKANSSENRGEQLLAQVEEIVALTGAEKVNLIGHSQGSLDIRYVATVRPDLVASITGVAGPNNGGIADIYDSFPEEFTPIGSTLMGLLGDLLKVLAGSEHPNDAQAMMEAFSVEGIEEFNRRYPIGLPSAPCEEGPAVETLAGHSIRVYSWTGIEPETNAADPTDLLMKLTAGFVPSENDGLVGRCDSHLGTVIRDDYHQNHLDEVNMMFGLVSPMELSPEAIFRAHANRLKNAGI